MFEDTNEVGIGEVICNSGGEIMETMSKKILKPPSMVILKSLAGRRAYCSLMK